MERTAKTIKPVMKLLQITLISLFLLTEASGQIVPEGFQNLAIGMTWKELIQVRPDVEIFDFGPDPSEIPDPEEPREILIEKISTGPIKGVLYGFKDGRLSMLLFSYSSESGIGDSLLRELLGRYGEYENIRTSPTTGYGVVKWIAGNLNLYLTIPYENVESRDKDIAYQIMDMQMAQEVEAGLNEELRKKPVDEVGLQAFKSRVQAIRNSVLPQEMYAPVVPPETTPELEPTE